MESKSFMLVAILLLLLTGCGRQGQRIEVGEYIFRYEGYKYSIRSVTPNFVQGYNILTRTEQGKIIFKAIDKEQDGILDEVAIGDISLDSARMIYEAGIDVGNRQGHVQRKTYAREYSRRLLGKTFVLVSHILALGDVYNRLVIKGIDKNEEIVVDLMSDGMLDKIEQGDKPLEEYQRFYRLVLNEGLKEKRISKIEGQFFVTK